MHSNALNYNTFFSLLEQEAATSTTPSETPPQIKTSKEPSEWSIEDVIQYIVYIDPALGVYADLFRNHVSFLRHLSFIFFVKFNYSFLMLELKRKQKTMLIYN